MLAGNRPADARFQVRRTLCLSWKTTTSTSSRHLVQGVDVWLNNPRRPLEASGTSGQKVVLNGGLESFRPRWLVGRSLRWHERDFSPSVHRPHSFEHGCSRPSRWRRSVPRAPRGSDTALFSTGPRWLTAWMDQAHEAGNHPHSLGWRFNADRMVMDYTLKAYVPAAGGTSSDMSRSR